MVSDGIEGFGGVLLQWGYIFCDKVRSVRHYLSAGYVRSPLAESFLKGVIDGYMSLPVCAVILVFLCAEVEAGFVSGVAVFILAQALKLGFI